MKKLLIVALVSCLIFSCAQADKISGPELLRLSFDELVVLKDRINYLLWNSKEWQEVTVPQGLWKVGEDIPAGSWTVKCAAEYTALVAYGDTLRPSGNSIKMNEYADFKTIVSPGYRNYQKGVSLESWSFTVKDGDYIEISNCDVIFTPYSGKPDLGFK